jgi:pheromone shutdown protein TraB
MAANIREVVGPGARVLAIVGASHKAYYERYLGMTSDVVLADMDRILD